MEGLQEFLFYVPGGTVISSEELKQEIPLTEGEEENREIYGRILREMKELLHTQCPEKKADKLETYLLEYWDQLNKNPRKCFYVLEEMSFFLSELYDACAARKKDADFPGKAELRNDIYRAVNAEALRKLCLEFGLTGIRRLSDRKQEENRRGEYVVSSVKQFVEAHYGDSICLEELAADIGLRGDDLIKETQEDASRGFYRENLARLPGVKVTADSVENEKFGASLAVDGNRRDRASRWSSANEAGQPEHWLMVEFPEERSVSFVRLYWERLNVEGFVLEASEDGENWVQAADWEGEQEANAQSIVLDKVVNGRFFRIRTTAVSTAEENQYLYYQNVSLLEMELYEEVPLVYCLEVPEIQGKEDGSRYLPLPVVPEGYEISFIGADYEEIIGEDGTVYPTLEEKDVAVGYRVSRDGKYEDSPAYTVTVPPDERIWETEQPVMDTQEGRADETGEEETDREEAVNSCPEVTPGLSEWKGKSGCFVPEGTVRLVLQTGREEELLGVAENLKGGHTRHRIPDPPAEVPDGQEHSAPFHAAPVPLISPGQSRVPASSAWRYQKQRNWIYPRSGNR